MAPDPSLAAFPRSSSWPAVPPAGVSRGGAGCCKCHRSGGARGQRPTIRSDGLLPKLADPHEARPMTRRRLVAFKVPARGRMRRCPPVDELFNGPRALACVQSDTSRSRRWPSRGCIASELPTFNASARVAGTPVAADKNGASGDRQGRARLFPHRLREDLAPDWKPTLSWHNVTGQASNPNRSCRRGGC